MSTLLRMARDKRNCIRGGIEGKSFKRSLSLSGRCRGFLKIRREWAIFKMFLVKSNLCRYRTLPAT